MKLTEENVESIFLDCFFKEGEDTRDAVKTEGIRCEVWFHPGRLEAHKAEIAELCDELPDNFKTSSGSGWSFLNMCDDKEQNQWTGTHLRVEQLMVLGLASGKMKLLAKREFWELLSGGMPYLMVNDENHKRNLYG